MPAPSALSAENSPTAAAAMAKAPSVLAARTRSRELAAASGGTNGVAADAARPTSPLSNPSAPGGAAGAGASPLDSLMDVNEVRRRIKRHAEVLNDLQRRLRGGMYYRVKAPMMTADEKVIVPVSLLSCGSATVFHK